MRRLDFVVGGVQTGGTTALDSLLRDHPGIRMARHKEIHYFDDERLDWSASDPARLDAQFDWFEGGVIRGEATPIYS